MSVQVLESLDDCVDLLRRLHDTVPAAAFSRPTRADGHRFDVFEVRRCVGGALLLLRRRRSLVAAALYFVACDCALWRVGVAGGETGL